MYCWNRSDVFFEPFNLDMFKFRFESIAWYIGELAFEMEAPAVMVGLPFILLVLAPCPMPLSTITGRVLPRLFGDGHLEFIIIFWVSMVFVNWECFIESCVEGYSKLMAPLSKLL